MELQKRRVETFGLDQVGTWRVPVLVGGWAVDFFNGDPNKVFIQQSEDPNQTLPRDSIRQSKTHNYQDLTQLWIVNTEAQAGKVLKLVCLPLGETAESGLHAVTLGDSSGSIIDPATEQTLDTLLATQKNLGDLTFFQVTVGTDAVQLADHTVPDGFSVVVKALDGNAGKVYVGRSGVTTANGFELSSRDSIPLRVSNTNIIYLIATAADQKVCVIVEKGS